MCGRLGDVNTRKALELSTEDTLTDSPILYTLYSILLIFTTIELQSLETKLASTKHIHVMTTQKLRN